MEEALPRSRGYATDAVVGKRSRRGTVVVLQEGNGVAEFRDVTAAGNWRRSAGKGRSQSPDNAAEGGS